MLYMGDKFESLFDDDEDEEPIPPKLSPYGPVIQALKQLVKALQILDNSEIVKQRRERAKKRWVGKSPAEKRANTAAARAAKSLQGATDE
jgi:hypothetical protein